MGNIYMECSVCGTQIESKEEHALSMQVHKEWEIGLKYCDDERVSDEMLKISREEFKFHNPSAWKLMDLEETNMVMEKE